MKKALCYSLVLHVLAIVLAVFLVQENKEKASAPFYASIVTPDEIAPPPARKAPQTPAAPPSPARLPSPPSRQKVTPPRTPAMPPVQDRLKTGPPPRAHDAPSPAERSAPHAAQRPSDQQEASSLPSTPRAAVPGSDRSNPAPPSAGDPLSAGSKTGREKIFDRDVLAKLTEPTPQSRQQDKGITFDTSEFKYYGYLQRLKEKIESIWRYPQGAAEQGIYGDLYVRFTIMKSGKLGAVELVRTSGYRALDEAAMKALWDAQPYWPLPNEWGREGFTITGHFIYTLHGVYIR